MHLRRISLLFAILSFILAGCFRQADMPLATVENQQVILSPAPADNQSVPPTDAGDTSNADDPDDAIVIIDPDAVPTQVEAPPTATEEDLTQLSNNDPNDVEIIDPDATNAPPATETPLTSTTPIPSPISAEETLATATEITIITPVGPSSQLPLDTPTPTGTPTTEAVVDDAGGVIDGDEDEDTPSTSDNADCTYTIQNGDNLFRIAITNGVSLDALLRENSLSENAIIQPGQVLRLPDCEAGETTTSPTATPPDDDTVTNPTPDTRTIHRVSSGETLGAIASRYGVSISAIVEANSLSNPDRLSIGQELVIPN